MNHLLDIRKYPGIDKQQYREIFSFPVRNYYSSAGFDLKTENFDDVAIEFMDQYFARLNQAENF